MSRAIKLHTVLTLAAAPLVLGVLGACGGGGGGVSVADGGIRGTGSSVGPVSGFGSVFVNGIEFFTDEIRNRSVTGNDGVNTEADLEKGMILRVEGVWEDDLTGTAQALNYDDTFRGPISSVEVDAETGAQTLTILGQTVVVDRRTVMRLGDAPDLAAPVGQPGNVRISAWHTGDGYRASFVGVLAELPDNWVELEGKVSRVNGQLQVNGQRITLSDNARYFNDLEPDGLVGEFVEFEGELNGEVVLAQTVRLSDDRRRILEVEDGELEISGPLVDWNIDAATFRVNGVTVRYTRETEFDGFRPEDLANGILVEVEGELRNGVLVAEEIELREDDAELEARVESIDSQSESLTILSVGGVAVHISEGRTLVDFDEALQVGSYLEIEGRERKDEQGRPFIEAVSVDLEDADANEDFQLQGSFSQDNLNVSANSLTVLGVEIRITGADVSVLQGCVEDEVSIHYESPVPGSYQATKNVECD